MAEGSEPDHHRLFIGIEAPADVRNRLVEAQRELAAVLKATSVRWTGPGQIHLTLRFLGNVASSRVNDLVQALKDACGSFPAIALRAQGVGFFPRPRSPKVVWAGLGGDLPTLTALQRRIEAATSEFSLERAEDRFHAHLTLGRVKFIDRQDGEALLAKAEAMSCESYGVWAATEVHLIRSQLSSKGSTYSVVGTAPLKGLS